MFTEAAFTMDGIHYHASASDQIEWQYDATLVKIARSSDPKPQRKLIVRVAEEDEVRLDRPQDVEAYARSVIGGPVWDAKAKTRTRGERIPVIDHSRVLLAG